MKNKTPSPIVPGGPLYKEVQALSLSVSTIRKAQGKKNPADFPADSPEWHQACLEICE